MELKERQRVGIIITDCMGGDAHYEMVSEEDYITVIEFNPTKEWMSSRGIATVLDADEFQRMVGDYFFDSEKGEPNEKVLKEWSTQTFVPEKIDLSEYDIIGMMTLPGG